MKTSPRIQRGPRGAGTSTPMRPRMQVDPWDAKVRSDFDRVKDLPPSWKVKSGMEALQSTVHSLPMTDFAPNLLARAVISLVGPARREVPESTMAFLQDDTELSPSLTPWSATSQ